MLVSSRTRRGRLSRRSVAVDERRYQPLTGEDLFAGADRAACDGRRGLFVIAGSVPWWRRQCRMVPGLAPRGRRLTGTLV